MAVFPTHTTRMFIRYRGLLAPAAPYVNKWRRVGEISNYGEISNIFEELRFDSVSATTAVIRKGRREPTRIPVTLGYDFDDTGQELMRDALEDKINEYQFKIVLSDKVATELSGGAIQYQWTVLAFRAQVSQFAITPGGASDWLTANAVMLVNSAGGVKTLRPTKTVFLPTIVDEEDEVVTEVQLEDPYYEEPEEL